MAWQSVPGLPGKVYVPEARCRGKKNPCPDCFECQQCSHERCTLCLAERCKHAEAPDPPTSPTEVSP